MLTTSTIDSWSQSSVADLNLEELMNIKVTTVTREASTVGQSPAAVFVITPQMIKESGATEIPELLRMVPGVEVARVDSNLWAISIRGFNSTLANKLLVQVDGRTVYNPLYSGTYWDGVDYPLEDIERIEVIRGPGGSVWGANAVNGVINIITKPARQTQGGLLDLGAGTLDHGFTTARYGDQDGENGYFRVYAKAFREGGEHSIDGDEHDAWSSARGGFRYDRTPAGGTAFTVQGDAYSETLGQLISFPDLNDPPTLGVTQSSPTQSQGGNLLARWSHQRSASAGWSLQTYYDNDERSVENGYASALINSADIDFQQQFAYGQRQHVVYGFGYLVQKILFAGSSGIDGASFAIAPAQVDGYRNVASTFLQDEIKLRQRVTLTLGSKLEHNYYTGLEYEPSARVLFSPSNKSSAWAAVSRAVRTPSLLERDITLAGIPSISGGTPTFFQEAANPNLASEHLIAYETGYRTQATDKISADAALFYNRYDNLVVENFVPGIFRPGPIPGSFYLPLVWENAENAHTDGVEISTTWEAGERWKIFGAYTYLQSHLTPSPGLGAALDGIFSAQGGDNPRNQAYLRSSLDLPHRVHFDLVGRYVDRLPGLGVPSYLTADAQLSWKKTDQLEFALVGQNLLDSRHLEFTGAGGNLAVDVARSAYFKVTRLW